MTSNIIKDKGVSKNDRAKKIAGLRNLPKNSIIFDQPCELGYHCPVCKYKDPKDDYDERLEWSEYEGFLWCRVCNKDYPSCLCMPDKYKATDIYLDCLSSQRQQAVNETIEKVEEMIEIMWIKKEKDKTGHDVGWNSALAELEARLKQLSQLKIKSTK